MLDIAIIGAGPAGLSAAINARIRNKTVKVFGNDPTTSWIYKAERVDNYMGMIGVTGKEMVDKFVGHAKEMGVEIVDGKVIEIFPMGDYYMLNVSNEFIEAKTIILANGLGKTKTLPGENEYLGKGVSYCATCDGPLYRGKNVVLVGDSPFAEEDVNYLSEVCEKVFYVPLYKEEPKVNENVEIIREKPKAVLGENVVTGLEFADTSLDVQGVFIIKENIPTTQLLKGLELDNQAIKVNNFMETNMAGIYAAGDCTGRPYQVAKAVGQGTVAALQAVSYLHEATK
ncbi:MAG: NAD(P)/FAD-dependent oxidoreductase [Cellulosilyticaceae bacterium]